FRIGEHYGWNGARFKARAFMSGDSFNSHSPFVRGLVRQHGLTRDITNRVDRRILRPALQINFDKTALSLSDSSFLKTIDLGVWTASNRNEHAIKHLLSFFDVCSFKAHAYAVLLLGNRS